MVIGIISLPNENQLRWKVQGSPGWTIPPCGKWLGGPLITNVHVQLRNPLKKFACRCACYFVGSIEILPLERHVTVSTFGVSIPSKNPICHLLDPEPTLPFFKQQNLCMQNVCLESQVTSYMIVCDLNMFHYHCTPVNKKKWKKTYLKNHSNTYQNLANL